MEGPNPSKSPCMGKQDSNLFKLRITACSKGRQKAKKKPTIKKINQKPQANFNKTFTYLKHPWEKGDSNWCKLKTTPLYMERYSTCVLYIYIPEDKHKHNIRNSLVT